MYPEIFLYIHFIQYFYGIKNMCQSIKEIEDNGEHYSFL